MRKRLLGFFLSVAFGMSFAGKVCGQAEWDARLTDFKGRVQVFASDDDALVLPPKKGMPLRQGDRIRTGAGSSAELALDGGSLIELSALSDFTFDDVRRSGTKFKLSAGTFLAKIKALLPGQDMQVETPAAVASVRGTEFGVEIPAETPDESHVGVFDEGKVEVRGRSGASVLITAGRETHVEKGGAPANPYSLKRLARYRRSMRTVVNKRLPEVRKVWKDLTAETRPEPRGTLEREDRDHEGSDDDSKRSAPEKEPRQEKVKPKER